MVNTDVLKTPAGYLKVWQTVLGVISLGISVHYSTVLFKSLDGIIISKEIFFFILVTYAFLMTTFLLLVSFLIDESADTYAKSIFEILYHVFGAILQFAAAVALVSVLARTENKGRDNKIFGAWVTAAVCGFLNANAYGYNSLNAFKARNNQIMVNTDVLKTPAGYLKLLQTVLGTISLGLSVHYATVLFKGLDAIAIPNEIFFFILVTYAFLMTTFLLLVSFLLEESADTYVKSHFEELYHAFGTILLLAAAVTLISQLANTDSKARDNKVFGALVTAAVCGLLNAIAYSNNSLNGYKARRI